MDKIQIQPRKIMQGCKGLTALRMIRLSYSLEIPLIVRHLAYKPVSQLNHETGKKETLSRANLNLAHSTWARWWRSWPQQDGTPSWLCLLDEVLRIAPPYSTMGELLLRCIFTYPWTHMNGKLQAYDLLELPYLELALHFFLLQPWSQLMVQALPTDNSYKYTSMQTLVHRDCH